MWASRSPVHQLEYRLTVRSDFREARNPSSARLTMEMSRRWRLSLWFVLAQCSGRGQVRVVIRSWTEQPRHPFSWAVPVQDSPRSVVQLCLYRGDARGVVHG